MLPPFRDHFASLKSCRVKDFNLSPVRLSAMFNNLLESKKKKQRRLGGTVFSFVAHYGLVLLMIYASAQAAQQDDKPREEKIDFVEARDDYLLFALGKERLKKQQTMGELEERLDPGRFVRIHRSYLLNVDRLARLESYGKDSWLAFLGDGTRLPVSRSGYARLRGFLG